MGLVLDYTCILVPHKLFPEYGVEDDEVVESFDEKLQSELFLCTPR